MTIEVRAGFMPLLDCAPLVVAREIGFAAAEGIELSVHRETSWAALRDRLAVGHLDVAHILAPMPIAANLGLGPLQMSLVVPMALGFGGNTVTVSQSVWRELEAVGAPVDFDAGAAVRALAQVVAARHAAGAARLVLGIVHAYSAHHYQLAYWMASAGIVPGRDVELVVVPPLLMPSALAGRQIDGFCAGEPWGSVAALRGAGRILTTNANIWRSCPEKVLGVRKAWAREHGERIERLVRAVYRAAVWCDDSVNRAALGEILARAEYIGQPIELLQPGLSGSLLAPNGNGRGVDGFLTFANNDATFPWTSHALWLYTQMVRWRQTVYARDALDVVRATYKPNVFRAALAPLGVVVPMRDDRFEDGFFDARGFDAGDVEGYLASFAVERTG